MPSPLLPRMLAWTVHLLTASGAVLGAWAIVAMHQGNLHGAALAMMVAYLVDGMDGFLARRWRVAEVIPWIDGRRLDDMVDYLNYVVVAVLFMLAAGHLPSVWWLAPPILASAYGFSNENAKTADDYFLGFPSYWNVMALYMWLLDISPEVGAAIVAIASIGVFVPLKYLYPSKMSTFKGTILVGGVLWFLALFACVAWPERLAPWHLAEVSLAYPVIYFVLSLRLGGWHDKSDAPAAS